jgi:hypothetical protein
MQAADKKKKHNNGEYNCSAEGAKYRWNLAKQ